MATLVRLGASMSLINQVLQDLDRRHASAAGVPASVRSLGAATLPTMQPRWPSAAGTALALATLVAVFIAWSGQTRGFATSVATTAPRQAMAAPATSAPALAASGLPAADTSLRAVPIDADRARFDVARIANQERHADRLFIDETLVEPTVIAQEKSLIRSVDDDRILRQILLVQIVTFFEPAALCDSTFFTRAA